MAYRIKRKEAPLIGVKRILAEQIAAAEAECSGAAGPLSAAAIHRFRKRSKRIRALYRLVKAANPVACRQENARWRDAARLVAAARDADALAACCKRLRKTLAPQHGDRRAIANLLRSVARRMREEREASVIANYAWDELRSACAAGRSALDKVSIESKSFAPVESGLRRALRRGRAAWKAARKARTSEALHEWRKRVKDQRAHVRLLTPSWPALLKPLEAEFGRLASALGDDHDLAALESRLRDESATLGSRGGYKNLLLLIKARRRTLQAEAFAIGTHLYALKPKEFSRLLRRQWRAWHRHPQQGAK